MRTALLADIHSNLEALQACLAHARREGVDRFAFLGDLVGYGADPVACLEIIAGLVGQGAPAVCGNHDLACLGGQLETMSFAARDAIYWTRDQIGPRERDFLAGLLLAVDEDDRLISSSRTVARMDLHRRRAEADRYCRHRARIVLSAMHEPLLFDAWRGARSSSPVPVCLACRDYRR
jgi:hypothetical protein